MTLVSNDPIWWYVIDANRTNSYLVVVAAAGVVYDSALTFAQEVELIWRQRWSLMTVLYLSLRYIGIVYAVISILMSLPTFSMTDTVSCIMTSVNEWINVVVPAMLGIIMIARLYAMYQGSRKVLILLVIIFLIVYISGAILVAMVLKHLSVEEIILSGTYQCTVELGGHGVLLSVMYAMLVAIWEILALCLAVWTSVKHFRELRQCSAGGMIGDCFKVLIKYHLVYFVSFLTINCCMLGFLCSMIQTILYSTEAQIYYGVLQIFILAQFFMLGPRLILTVREYRAKLMADSDAELGMTSIVFQGRVHVATCASV